MNQEFNEMLRRAGSICILGHTNPDGDCLGSTLGVWNYIRNRYPEKKAKVYLMESNAKFAFLPGYSEIIHEPSVEHYDLALQMDCHSDDRLGDFSILRRKASSCYTVDHHLLKEGEHPSPATVLPEASSASEVVFDLMDPENVDRNTATCLYTGIVHDTGVFKYDHTTRHTMEIAGFLMSKGIDFGSIIDDSYFMKTYCQQQVQGRVMMESILVMDRRILAGWLRLKEMQFYHVTSRDIDGIVTTMRETRGVDGAVFLYETANQVYKVSLRSNNDQLDVAKAASYFGGGGHKKAAGCTLQGSYYDVLNNITKALSEQMDAPGFHSNRGPEES